MGQAEVSAHVKQSPHFACAEVLRQCSRDERGSRDELKSATLLRLLLVHTSLFSFFSSFFAVLPQLSPTFVAIGILIDTRFEAINLTLLLLRF